MARSTINSVGSTTRIPVTAQTSQPVGSLNPAAATARSTAPPNIRTLGPYQPTVHGATFAENRRQRAVQQALAGVGARYDSRQQVIPGVTFAAMTPLVVPHRLGRAYVGAYLINVRPVSAGLHPIAGESVVANTDTRLDAFQVQLQTITACVADVVVF